MASARRTLYIGVTTDLEDRVFAHKTGRHAGFSRKYNCTRLVYCEEISSVVAAISREKELKGWLRKKKLMLIAQVNPDFHDLAATWFPEDAIDKAIEINKQHARA